MKVLVTGGAGFIGSRLALELVEQGHEVLVLDNLSAGKKENVHPSARLINGDIRDYKLVLEASKGADCIFHLAAFVSVPMSVEKPDECRDVNVGGTLNIIKAAGENGVRKIIFSSSCAVYGDRVNTAASEADTPNPLSPYAVSKLEGEKLLESYSKEFDYSYINLRYFNVFGENQNPDSPYSGVMSKFIYRVLRNQEIVIYGAGSQTRDFIYVRDVVNANIRALTSDITNEVFNIGTGKGTSINDLAGMIIKSCSSDSQISYEPGKPGDIHFSLSDITKAKEQLSWRPRHDVEEAISTTIRWYKDNY